MHLVGSGRYRTVLLLALCAAVVSGTGSAFAVQPQIITTKLASVGGSVGVDARGNALVLFSEAHGSRFPVMWSYRPAGGRWSRPTVFSDARYVGSAFVAMASDGVATAIWS